MSTPYQSLGGFWMGMAIALVLVVTIGAVRFDSGNTTGDTTTSFNNLATSSDGRIVYVCDDDHVYRSTDSGANWQVVLEKREADL